MYVILNDELYHHGIKGQHWGVRRFQNADGTRTAAGKNRYGGSKREEKQARKREGINEYSKVMDSYNRDMKKADEVWKQAQAKYDSLGPNAMSKIRAVRKGQKGEGSKDVKEYLALYDKFDEIADTAWERKMEAQNRLGKSVVKAYNKETRAAKKEAKRAEREEKTNSENRESLLSKAKDNAVNNIKNKIEAETKVNLPKKKSTKYGGYDEEEQASNKKGNKKVAKAVAVTAAGALAAAGLHRLLYNPLEYVDVKKQYGPGPAKMISDSRYARILNKTLKGN